METNVKEQETRTSKQRRSKCSLTHHPCLAARYKEHIGHAIASDIRQDNSQSIPHLWSMPYSPFSKQKNIKIANSTFNLFTVSTSAAVPKSFMGIMLGESEPAGCNESSDEIASGRSPRCRSTHQSEPLLVTQLAGPFNQSPLHLCHCPSRWVGGDAGALVVLSVLASSVAPVQETAQLVWLLRSKLRL